MSGCTLCPRMCGVDRTVQTGYCGSGSLAKVARAAKHHWEEPCISGTQGSGTVFFSGCTLGCVFCQNREISRGGTGREVTPEHLADIFRRLESQGVHNLNLVTPVHFTRVETLRRWENTVQIYLPDLKYHSPELSAKYSAAPDYFEAASKAILEMHRQQPKLVWEGDLLKQGLIIRHLVLPGCVKDSMKVLDFLHENLPKDSFLLSLMSQYTPTPACAALPEINRRITTYEYRKVADRAAEMGFSGFAQDRRSAKEEYTPPFDLEGV